LTTLEAVRDKLAQAIDEGGAKRDLAPLSRQLTDVLAKIEAHRPAVQKPADELKAARRKRQATARASRKLVEVNPDVRSSVAEAAAAAGEVPDALL
jgi:hypothetical protein